MPDLCPATSPPSARPVLLGVFLIAQLLFLVSSNLIGFLKDNRTELGPQARQAAEALAPGWPDEKGHVWHALEHVSKTDKMWAQLTGQLQVWSLFAPTIGRECVFPALELRWDDDPMSAPALARPLALLSASHPWEALSISETLQAADMHHELVVHDERLPLGKVPDPELILSDNEPADLLHFFRFGNFRLRRYESSLVITLRPHEDEKPEKTNERWSESIRSHVADYSDIIQGYLRRRVSQAMERWPGRPPPRQVILLFRRFHINDYEDAPPFWQGPFVVPVARWQPAVTWDGAHQPLEWHDPVTDRFKSLRK
jgi:hypothetical protein